MGEAGEGLAEPRREVAASIEGEAARRGVEDVGDGKELVLLLGPKPTTCSSLTLAEPSSGLRLVVNPP
jgi:hypothetical protein